MRVSNFDDAKKHRGTSLEIDLIITSDLCEFLILTTPKNIGGIPLELGLIITSE